jgi:hypothetical protein
MNKPIQKGQAGEIAAEAWFRAHDWHMTRTQPPVTILGILTGRMVSALKRYIPRLSHYGHMAVVRVGNGGVPDFTGYIETHCGIPEVTPVYMAVEVKECNQDTMPASRVSKEQRAFLAALPEGSAWVGILWGDGKFRMYSFIERGSYKRDCR